MSSNYDDIRKYLLGDIEAADREAIDLRLLDDEDYGVEALAAEDLLIESYLDGELTEAEMARFHSHYLISEARDRRLKELAAFRAAVRQSDSEGGEAFETEPQAGGWSFADWLRGFNPVPVVAILLIAVIGAGLWFYFSIGRPSGLEQEYAALNRRDMSDLTGLSTYSSVELFPGTMRSNNPGSRFKAESLTEAVLFRLPIEAMGEEIPYRVMVLRDGNAVFSVYDQRPVRNGSVQEIRVLLPKKIFVRGQYQIRVSQLGTKAAPFVYNFVVE